MHRIQSLALAAMLAGCALAGTAAAQSAQDEACSVLAGEVCNGKALGACFQDQTKWAEVGTKCEGAVQTLIENEREALQEQAGAVSAVGMTGFSYGGILRKGPGMDAGKVASLKKGDKIEIIEDPDVETDGYRWFKVRSPRGTGYHWGGIFCIPGDTLPAGVMDNCQFMNQ